MTYNPKIHHRRSIRIKDYDYSSGHAYYITICTQDRLCVLGDVKDGIIELNSNGRTVKDTLKNLPSRYPGSSLESYVIMPNHVHFIIQLRGAIRESPLQGMNARRQMTLPKTIGFLKMNTAKAINKMRGTSGGKVWQKDYFEHIIRNEKSYGEITEYIYNNPYLWHEDEYNPNKPVKPLGDS